MWRAPTSVITVDVGATAGIARFWAYQSTTPWAALQRSVDEAPPTLALAITEQMQYGVVEVVGERFIIGARTVRKTRQRDASDLLGWLKLQYAREPRVHFVMQSASDAKNLIPDATLRRLGWYQPGQPHANDASRHLALRVLRWWPETYAALLGESVGPAR
jgi:hypothetical protein